ncbi:MAG: hypothetical protein M1837_004380 [Sclerophora amabilis]|nr:MAG: hypothetical protein M1837_004380 [Sclerophora amabilis]
MRLSVHRYILAPTILAAHGFLLLPALLARPPKSEVPTPSLVTRLHPQWAIPFGILAFLVIHAVRWLAGGFPLPQDRRRRALASRIEWGLLFLLGVFEELWRWVLVRVLVELEGGRGGYAGTTAGLSRPGNMRGLAETDAEPRRLGIWEGVYLMCWTWSLVEAAVLTSGLVCMVLHLAPVQCVEEDTPPELLESFFNSDRSSPSSAGKPKSFFTDLFIRPRSHSIRTSSSSSSEDEGDRDQGRVAVSDPSSDGDDEDSSSSSSNASLTGYRSADSTRAHSPTRPLLGGSTFPAPPHSSHGSFSLPSPGGVSPNNNGVYLPSTPSLNSSPRRSSTLFRLPSFRRNSSTHHEHSPTIYTIPLRTLPSIYPVFWRLTSLFAHIAYGLLYAWFPTLILSLPRSGNKNGSRHMHLEWWTLIVLLVIALCKGNSTAFWFRGTAVRLGVAWVTGASLIAAVLVWLVGLALWGIVDGPWD